MRPGSEAWELLRNLRSRFIDRTAGADDYWDSDALLAAYDATFAQRIAWKWQAVLADLDRLGWTPPDAGIVADFGCGSGVAGRAVLSHFGLERFSGLRVRDRSARAESFALRRASERFPSLPCAVLSPTETIGLLLISHVASELTSSGEALLQPLLEAATSVIWVEPGTPADSAVLGRFRERWRGVFRIIAPCPHQGRCGVSAPDWCHFHARPPVNAFTDPEWSEFSREVGVDLRALPYSYLVLDRRPAADRVAGEQQPGVRMLGRPSVDKVAVRFLACASSGEVADRELLWRGQKSTCKRIEKRPYESWVEPAE